MKSTFKIIFVALPLVLLMSSGVLLNGVLSSTAHAQGAASRVDLRPYFDKWHLSIKPQQQRDTCAVFTITGAMEYALARKLNRGVRLSEEYLNWAANRVMNLPLDGASLSELERGFTQWGVCEEKYMPYGRSFNPSYEPSPQAIHSAREIWEMGFKWHWLRSSRQPGIAAAEMEKIRKVLRDGWPVCAGGDEHNMLLAGYNDDARQPGGGTFLVRNSATRRYETVTYAAAQAQICNILWIEIPNDSTQSNPSTTQ